MSVLLFILAMICIVYLIAIILYIGWSGFVMFWAALGFMFLMGGVLLKYNKMHPFHIPTKISVVLIVTISIFVLIFSIVEGQIIYFANSQPKPQADYIVVLGAKVNGEMVSLMLKKRLDQTYEYAVDNPATKIIVSGGQGEGESITEAEAMFRYLTQKGVSADRILKEERSTNTNENIKFSKELIHSESAMVVIVSNGFHILRSLRLCQKNGLINVSGAGAPTSFGLHAHYYAREAFAYVKDFLIGNI